MTTTAVQSGSLLQETEQYVQAYFAEKMSEQYVFHDWEHTVQTVAAARMIGEGCELDEHELLLLQLATWFHDTGYAEGPADHEERSCVQAEAYLSGKISEQDLEVIKSCIRSTKVPQRPISLLDRIICDADLSHLGMDSYWDRTSRLRQEFTLTRQWVMSDSDWVDFELDFLLNHDYHTAVASDMFNKRKAKHIQQLVKQKRRLNPSKAPTLQELALLDEKDKSTDFNKILKESENEIKMARFGRGVETMYRTTYRTHTNLSSMADSKANLMLSVNAIVISILVSNLLPKILESQGKLLVQLAVPTVFLTLTCLGSMIYATLSTRPKVTEGKVDREAIRQRKANLLFFGNFYNMKLEEFQWGVNEMLKDPEFLYSSMSRDLYFLGIVLAKKYRYLSLCYNIFMYGLISSVLAFAIAFAL
ncbi:MAG: HD domain-containing protein [Saprospiraceae bacterium]|nr:HD domain-containing protein [Saprospiraceae bacterium]